MKKISLLILALGILVKGSAQQVASITIGNPGKILISKDIYGQFAEHLGRSIYDGFFRNGKIRMDVVEALKEIKVPNLRWPGGCFADQYHWMDGVHKKTSRPVTVNTTWGMVSEDNSFGTKEFLELCSLIGCAPYIAGNVGTGTPQEMKNWIEYLNFDGKSTLADWRAINGHPAPYKVALWGVGNESWGCGGNMTPEYYAGLYRHFAAFCMDYPGSPLKRIVSGANSDDYNWTKVMMEKIPLEEMWGLSLHYYTLPTGKWNPRGPATGFSESEYISSLTQGLKIEEILNQHEAIMDRYDPKRKVALVVDEWGVWTDVEKGTNPQFMYQQNSLRDALVAASTLNIFNNHAGRVRGANLAQTVNVIQSLILTRGDDMLLTPTYFVFKLFALHQDAWLLPMKISGPWYTFNGISVPAVNGSASVDTNGEGHISLVNLDAVKTVRVKMDLGVLPKGKISGEILTSAHFNAINTFEKPAQVKLQDFGAFDLKNKELNVGLPPMSVVMLSLK